MKAAENYGLPVPKFQAFDNMFRVHLFRKCMPITDEKNDGNSSEKHRSMDDKNLNETQKKNLELLSGGAHLSATKMAEKIGIASRNVEANIKGLKDRGILIRHGSPRSGYWEIMK